MLVSRDNSARCQRNCPCGRVAESSWAHTRAMAQWRCILVTLPHPPFCACSCTCCAALLLLLLATQKYTLAAFALAPVEPPHRARAAAQRPRGWGCWCRGAVRMWSTAHARAHGQLGPQSSLDSSAPAASSRACVAKLMSACGGAARARRHVRTTHRGRAPGVELVNEVVGDLLQALLRERAQQRPCHVQRLEHVARLVGACAPRAEG